MQESYQVFMYLAGNGLVIKRVNPYMVAGLGGDIACVEITDKRTAINEVLRNYNPDRKIPNFSDTFCSRATATVVFEDVGEYIPKSILLVDPTDSDNVRTLFIGFSNDSDIIPRAELQVWGHHWKTPYNGEDYFLAISLVNQLPL